MPLSDQQLISILPASRKVASVYAPMIAAAMDRFQINTRLRQAAFIAQAGHESGQLTTFVENLNYSAQALLVTWPKRFTAALAAQVARNPEKIAAIVYDGRNGNNQPGDGFKYRGRGMLQITGKDNYRACGISLGLDLLNFPQKLEEPANAALASAWWWFNHGLNDKADKSDFVGITQVINGGQNGADERGAFYKAALKVIL